MLLPLAVVVWVGCSGTRSAEDGRTTPKSACIGPQISHRLGEYLEDVDATIAHLKTSYMGQSAMSPAEIEDHVAKGRRFTLQLTSSGAQIGESSCCIQRVLADTETDLAFDALCTPRGGEKRFSFRPYHGRRLLLVTDMSPGEPHDPNAIGFNAIRYEEFVFVPARVEPGH